MLEVGATARHDGGALEPDRAILASAASAEARLQDYERPHVGGSGMPPGISSSLPVRQQQAGAGSPLPVSSTRGDLHLHCREHLLC
jgi:hypothetical protein